MSRGFWGEIRWTVGEWLAAGPLWRLVLCYDGEAPKGRGRYVNRLNHHLVLGPSRDGAR